MSVFLIFIAWQGSYFAAKYWGFDFLNESSHSEKFDIAERASIIFFTAWCLLWLPFKRHQAQECIIKALQRQLDDRSAWLEIEGVPIDIPGTGRMNKKACQIRIHNKSSDKSAKNVRVELVGYEDSPNNKEIFRPSMPLELKPEGDKDKTINPGTAAVFNLFSANKPAAIEGQPARPLAADLGAASKYLLFEKDTNYRLKIRASADDFPPVTAEFNLKFGGGKHDYRFAPEKTSGT